jgi:hypothetical protein
MHRIGGVGAFAPKERPNANSADSGLREGDPLKEEAIDNLVDEPDLAKFGFWTSSRNGEAV